MKIKFQSGRAALQRGLDFWRRGSAALPLLAAIILSLAVGAAAETTNTLSDAEIQGRALAQNILDNLFEAATGSKVAATLQIRNSQSHLEIPLTIFTVRVAENTWPIIFYQIDWTNRIEQLSFHPTTNQPISFNYDTNITTFKLFHPAKPLANNVPTIYDSLTTNLTGNAAMIPFAGSDFWLFDLSLEFFHWPEQKILPNPTSLKCGRSYTLLESTNPNPSTNGYSRVLSWIDKETGGILQAEAYDAQGRLLKVFEPDSFKKVNGQWELQEMEIRNVQTGSRTRLEFDLNKQ